VDVITSTTVKRGEYYDSVTLLEIAQQLMRLEAVVDAAVVMGTEANKSLLTNAYLLTPEAAVASPDDLVIAVRTDTPQAAEAALALAESALKATRAPRQGSELSPAEPKTVASASRRLPGANVALISVAGHYAARVAREALDHGLHVFVFSDNVALQDEVSLKQLGRERGLLVMGPDAGTAIINGVALGFANKVLHTPPAPGGVGVVAAAGTGLQAVTSELSRRGIGITQAIGTGGRDLSRDVGGIMMLEGLKALQSDPTTEVIVLVSKPPSKEVAGDVLAQVRCSAKPTVVCFLGGKKRSVAESGATSASTLEEAAVLAASLAAGRDPATGLRAIKRRNKALRVQALAARDALHKRQRFYRGLFSGGTFCYETQIILSKMLGRGQILSNVPIWKQARLADDNTSQGHTAVDLGDDKFTVGRLHPMLDPTLRNRRIIQEASDPETAVISLDIVLGYGAHPDPAGAAVEAIDKARRLLAKRDRSVVFLAHVCGTEGDPQNASTQEEVLRDAGVIVLPTNAAAARFAAYVLL
jgi:FdrA protein